MRFDPTPYPSNFDDVTRGLNFSFPPNAFKVIQTFSAGLSMIMDLDTTAYSDEVIYLVGFKNILNN